MIVIPHIGKLNISQCISFKKEKSFCLSVASTFLSKIKNIVTEANIKMKIYSPRKKSQKKSQNLIKHIDTDEIKSPDLI